MENFTKNTRFFPYKEMTDKDLQIGADLLMASEIIAFPTETVYGLGASALDLQALENLYTLKKRSPQKAMIIHIADIEDVYRVAEKIPEEFFLLSEKFFPGPLTIVLKKRKEIPSLISSDDTIAVRMPDHDLTRKLLRLAKDPIVGTSANMSGAENLIRAEDVYEQFKGQIAAVFDGGECQYKKPSTVIGFLGDKMKLFREGAIEKSKIEDFLHKNFSE
jgi:L-threonylcarbamoyladenylate synthase